MTLPPNWQALSLDGLYAAINDPARYPTPQSTVDAIVWAVRDRGLPTLHEAAQVERLSRCDAATRRQINERIENLLPQAEAS